MPHMMLGRAQQFLLVASAALAGFAIPISTAAQNIGTGLLVLCFLGMAPLRAQLGHALRLPFVRACLVLYLLLLLGISWADVSWAERFEMLERMRAYLFAPIFVACMMSHAGRQGLIGGFCTGVVLTVVASIGMAAAGNPILHGVDGNYTAFRTHTYHNLFIAWMAIGLLASLLWGQIENRRLRMAAIVILTILLFDALFLVRGRSAQILLLMMIGLVCLRGWGLRALLPLILGTTILLPALYFTSSQIREGTALVIRNVQDYSHSQVDGNSVGLRLEFAHNTLKIISQAPLFGHGTGSFRANYEKLTGFTKATHGERACHNPHNDYLWLWSEIGPLGALGLLGVLFAFVRNARQLPRPQRLAMEAIALSMLVGTLANSFFTDNTSGVGFIVVASALVAGPWWPRKEVEAA